MFSVFFLPKHCFIPSTILLLTADSLALTPARRSYKSRNSIGNRMSSNKRKYVSDGLDILESFAPLEGNPGDVHTLILGTLPSDKSYGQNLSGKEIILRGGDGHQNYGHSRNSFWNIIGSAFGFQRHQTLFEDQVRFLTDEGYSVWDVLSEAKRKGSLDANLVKGSLIPTDLPKFILDHPNLNRFVFAANSAEIFCKKEVWAEWLATGEAKTLCTATSTDRVGKNGKQAREQIVKTKFWIQGSALNPETFARTNGIFGKKKAVETIDDPALSKSYSKVSTVFEDDDGSGDESMTRVIELIVMPSTSPASARIRPPEKEKKWHTACYRLMEPPKHYVCPGCEYRRQEAGQQTSSKREPDQHWFHDCPYRDDWKVFKKEQNKKKTSQKTSTDDDWIDPFYWYM
jgi:hypoxanthine-DNA glycosylase